jgi:cellulose synthase/poly-beta-1,6-N-acetylglucosamine synthase-like glycosyltransferase/peptidoglycan/xylan/chitin deacetylase (PgdA/CDA1 family)
VRAKRRTQADAPVFFDEGGRRWKTLRIVALVLLGLVVISAIAIIPAELSHEPVPSYNPATTSARNQLASYDPHLDPYALSDRLGKTELPVIGDPAGPFAEVIHVTHEGPSTLAVPLYQKGIVYPLDAADAATVGTSSYAILHYGAMPPRELALTFDDGPDPTWTPAILNILSSANAPASFFEIGSEVAKHPAEAARAAKEGHVLGNHTFDHVDFDYIGRARADQEFNQAQHVIRAATGHATGYARLPYSGNDPQALRDSVTGILEAERFGYAVTYFDFDSQDWHFSQIDSSNPTFAAQFVKYPTFDGASHIVLLHDGGGDRSKTLPYLTNLINMAKANGYKLVNLDQMFPQNPSLFAPTHPSLVDNIAFMAAKAYFVWPKQLVSKLFYVAAVSLLFGVVLNFVLACLNVRRDRRRSWGRAAAIRDHPSYIPESPLVSVIIPAYKEEAVIERTVTSILASEYTNLEVVIVDDGSPDGTYSVACGLDEIHDRVSAHTKANGGKAEALNLGIELAEGEIIIAIDADTVFPPHTVPALAHHFADPRVGAVAGSVKVGNVRGTVTRWQALDYAIGINIERNAQALLRAVMIVPGACGAWRRSVLKEIGGFPTNTLAEDFDLALCVHEAGYRVLQDTSAYGLTEAPLKLRPLIKQRSRWIFGHFQVYWKHRRMIFARRYGWLGMLVLPAALVNLALPIVFVPLLVIIDIENILAGNWFIVLAFLAVTIAIQAMVSLAAVLLGRERRAYLWAVPFTRLVYMPVRTALLYRSVLRAIKGAHFGWNKVARTATVLLPGHSRPHSGPRAGERRVRRAVLFLALPAVLMAGLAYEFVLPPRVGGDYLHRLLVSANALSAADTRLLATQNAAVFSDPDRTPKQNERDLSAAMTTIDDTRAQLARFRKSYAQLMGLPGAGFFGTYHQAVVQHTLAARLDAQSELTLDRYGETVSYLQRFYRYQASMIEASDVVDRAGPLGSLPSATLTNYQQTLNTGAVDISTSPAPRGFAALTGTAGPMFANASQALGQLVQGLNSGSDEQMTRAANAFDAAVATNDSSTKALPTDLISSSYTTTIVNELRDKVLNLSVEGGGSTPKRS